MTLDKDPGKGQSYVCPICGNTFVATEEWRDLLGDNLIFWLCARIEELEEEINHGGFDL